MLSYTSDQLYFLLVGFCGGISIGMFLPSKTDTKKRSLHNLDPFPSRSPALVMIRSGAIAIALICVMGLIFLLVVLTMSHIFGIRFERSLSRPFALSVLAGAAIGKTGRYLYWQSK
jgi:hypothetical protein